jgi:hypothetical protein
MKVELASVCERCNGMGFVYWGRAKWLNCDWYVPCPVCRPNEEQRHPYHRTLRLGDGYDEGPQPR